MNGRHKLGWLQRRLEAFYELEAGPNIVDYVRESAEPREAVLIRENADDVELAVLVPSQALDQESVAADVAAQLIEGVSHFVLLVERLRTELPTSQLELELQAEIDKYVLLALDAPPEIFAQLPEILYERVSFLHPPDTHLGARYRLANHLAARFVRRHISAQGLARSRSYLRRFYRAGLTDKIHMAQAA